MDFEKRVATTKPVVKLLSAENEALKNKVVILAVEAENGKEHVTTLEKSLQVEKDFSKLKDKQIGDLQFKLQKFGPVAMEEFKEFDSYSNDLCEYYVEGFELFRKWLAKHHLDLDLFSLVMGEVKKKLLADHCSEVTAENVMEEAMTITDVMEGAMTIAPTDSALSAPKEQ